MMADRVEARGPAHPRTRLDDNFSTPIRFSLMASLGEGIELDFATLAEILQASDSALSKAISHLQQAGYVTGRKGYVGTRPRTWVRSTAAGLSAFDGHLRALREIVELGGQRMP
ncbi:MULTISPECIES: transcriptional regulator [unclassified Microbacterium]|uniref:winged helix-turn-helix domain-containing protein n=1 Tax=unclassified Microbacterium TaxID=2609290 RepID=UPI001FAF2DF4|nr:transcriptional regulator [Microbacterium sp. TPD7012]